MTEARKNFFTAVERKVSSAELLLSKPEKLQSELVEIQSILESEWPSIFATLNEAPLNESEKKTIRLVIERLTFLEKEVSGKLTFFTDFQKHIQVSLEK